MATTAPATPRGGEACSEDDPETLRKMVDELRRANRQLSEQLQATTLPPSPTNTSPSPAGLRGTGKVNELRAVARHRHGTRQESNNDIWTSAADLNMPEDEAAAPASEPAKAKSEEQTTRIVAALAKKAPFDTLEETQMRSVADAMSPFEAKADAVLVKEGDDGRQCFLLDSGELRVMVKGVEKDRIKPGEIFGELALMYNVPRTATIEAVSDAALYVLDRPAFRRTLRQDAVRRRREIYYFLRSCAAFETLDDRAIYRVADVVVERSFEEGASIIKEGTDCDDDPCMYFVKEGSVVVKQAIPEEERAAAGKEETIIRIMRSGEYFGERALILNEPRSCTVEAVGSTVCLRIDRDAFRSMLDPLHAELRSKMPKDSSPTWLRKSKMGGGSSGGNSFIKSANERAASMAVLAGKSIQRYAPLKDGIQLLKPLGSGGFARVLLAKDNATRRLFALKVIHKGKLLEKKAEARTTQVFCRQEQRHVEQRHVEQRAGLRFDRPAAPHHARHAASPPRRCSTRSWPSARSRTRSSRGCTPTIRTRDTSTC